MIFEKLMLKCIYHVLQQVINAKKAQGQNTFNIPVSSGVMFRKDIFYGGSLYNIPEYKYVRVFFTEKLHLECSSSYALGTIPVSILAK